MINELRSFLENNQDKKIALFSDMDGVIADFDVGKAKDYDKKRPLKTSIEKLTQIAIKNRIRPKSYVFFRVLYLSSFEYKNEL